MKTLLFVEPEAGIRGLLHAIFAGRYRVLEAEDGESALGLICIERPDLVLFELELPDISGFEMCQLVKCDQQFRSTRLVALTTAVNPASRLAAMQAGADGYITKPFRPALLRGAVDDLLMDGGPSRALSS